MALFVVHLFEAITFKFVENPKTYEAWATLVNSFVSIFVGYR